MCVFTSAASDDQVADRKKVTDESQDTRTCSGSGTELETVGVELELGHVDKCCVVCLQFPILIF